MSAIPPTAPFAEIETWIFDLDNTLYPPHTNLFAQVDQRIRDYVVNVLKVDEAKARAIQKDYYRLYGTTLRGLMMEHEVAPDDFLAYVHDIDHSPLEPNPVLGHAIERLNGRKLVLTNGSRRHAENVLARLGISEHFEDMHDIVAAELTPKPYPEAYERFIARYGVDPRRAAMFEDLSRNLEVPHRLGMRTVLVVPEGAREVLREDWEMEGRDAPHVDFVTDDLVGFLNTITNRQGG